MIKALMLIFEPGITWERISLAKWRIGGVLAFFLVPLLALTLAGELFGLAHWGKLGAYIGRPQEFAGTLPVSRNLLITYGMAQLISSLLLVVVGAALMKSIARTFSRRNTYTQCFNVTAHAFGPLFLLRLCDALPSMNPWVSFGIGMVLTVATLYHGIPWVLDPDPPHAFGLYVSSALMLSCLAALLRFSTLLVLAQKIHI